MRRCSVGSKGRSPPSTRSSPAALSRGTTLLNIQVGNRQRILLDELPAGLDLIAHEGGENVVGRLGVFDAHFDQATSRWVDGGLPQLFRIHFAQAFVALQALTFASLVEQPTDG